MKQKPLKYIMLVVVVMIWTKVIYDIVQSSNDETIVVNSEIVAPIKDYEQGHEETQSFSLHSKFRDPFLGKAASRNKNTVIPQTKRIVTKKEEPEPPKQKVRWPNIKYFGMMQNNTTGEVNAIFSIHNQEYVNSIGDTINDLMVLENVFTDSISLSQAGETKTIVKHVQE
ncbi:hypothetical protein [Halocola ammonii]